ncbi:helix-turn-helix domain-containing protein, partial [Enorma massiliensis]
MEIGTRIREHRQANGMKQEALAAACKVSRQTVSNWERNKTLPDIASLKAIATAFDTSVDALIGDDAPHIIERFDADSRRFLVLFFLMQVCWVSSSLLRLFAANAPNHEEELSIAVAEA